jgi:hypothetical protein
LSATVAETSEFAKSKLISFVMPARSTGNSMRVVTVSPSSIDAGEIVSGGRSSVRIVPKASPSARSMCAGLFSMLTVSVSSLS